MNPGRGRRFLPSPSCPDGLWGSQEGHKVDYQHIVPKLRMRGAVPLLPVHAFMAQRGQMYLLTLHVCVLVQAVYLFMMCCIFCHNAFECICGNVTHHRSYLRKRIQTRLASVLYYCVLLCVHFIHLFYAAIITVFVNVVKRVFYVS